MRARVLALGLVSALAAAPSLAVENLSGRWEGTLKCVSADNGGAEKSKNAVVVNVFQDEGGIAIAMVDHGLFLDGFVLEEPAKPDTGTVSAVGCGFSGANLNGSGVFRATVKTKTGDVKATLKGTTILIEGDPDPSMSLCTFTAKRVSATPDGIPPCV
jgi:hypothetical protein